MQGLEGTVVGNTVYVDEFGEIKEYKIDRITTTQVCSGSMRFRKKDGLMIGTGSDSWAGTYATPINEHIRSRLRIQRVQRRLWASAKRVETLSRKVNRENCEQIEEIANRVGEALRKWEG